MELDLLDVHFDLKDIKPREIEEALEDPFSVRFLPDRDRSDGRPATTLWGEPWKIATSSSASGPTARRFALSQSGILPRESASITIENTPNTNSS